jgi:hypothetical protein
VDTHSFDHTPLISPHDYSNQESIVKIQVLLGRTKEQCTVLTLVTCCIIITEYYLVLQVGAFMDETQLDFSFLINNKKDL